MNNVRVTQGNMATVYDRVKRALRGKTVTFYQFETKNLKKIKREKKSADPELIFKIKNFEIKLRDWPDEGQVVANLYSKNAYLIRSGDKITIKNNEIVVVKYHRDASLSVSVKAEIWSF